MNGSVHAMFLAGAIVCAAAFAYTFRKIDRMRTARGMNPGAEFVKGRVESKHGMPFRGSEAYLITVSRPGAAHEEFRVDGETWDRLKVGDSVDVAVLPGGETELKDGGIWAGDGNLIFDYVLLIGESLGGLAILAAWMVAVRRSRKSPRELV